MMKNTLAILLISGVLSACTTSQSNSLGLNTSTLTQYAQNMSNSELCQVLYLDRATTQTQASVATEFNRRGLSKTWCDQELNEYYTSSFVDWMLSIDLDNDGTSDAVTLPATIL